MGNRRKKKYGNHGDLYEFKISELLNLLAVRKIPPRGSLLCGLLQNGATLPILLLVRRNASTVQGTLRSKALLPDCFQALSDAHYRRRYHQTQVMPLCFSTPTLAPTLAPTPALNTSNYTSATTPAKVGRTENKRTCLVSPDSFFLPYLAERETKLVWDSLSSIRDLFQKGELCSVIVGVHERTDQGQSKLWREAPVRRMSIKPGVTSVRYFEDIRDLQRKLFQGILGTSAGLCSYQRESGAMPKTLRTIDTSLRCSPPLVCRNNIYYSAFSSPK